MIERQSAMDVQSAIFDEPDRDDDAPARGVLIAIIMSIILWILAGSMIVALAR